jgi:hypothetical protein
MHTLTFLATSALLFSHYCCFQQVLARRHIDILTASAWLLGTKELEVKVSCPYRLEYSE